MEIYTIYIHLFLILRQSVGNMDQRVKDIYLAWSFGPVEVFKMQIKGHMWAEACSDLGIADPIDGKIPRWHDFHKHMRNFTYEK